MSDGGARTRLDRGSGQPVAIARAQPRALRPHGVASTDKILTLAIGRHRCLTANSAEDTGSPTMDRGGSGVSGSSGLVTLCKTLVATVV
jgi:hypothetical protein